MSARSLMVMGTASDVGKSLIVTALCRALAQHGIKVAPFKSQNMSNNAAVCAGGEIGRAQAAQAEACGLVATVDMNPVLLKPEGERRCQVVIRGQARFRMGTNDYERYREAAWPAMVDSYRRLAADYELIVIEGAGGAAEVNLRDRDLVNWRIADLADAPVLLVGDIDKGGVFAALYGTAMLIEPAQRARLRGLLINKFRGDPRLLGDGLDFLAAQTGVAVLGVIPYLPNLALPQEDSAALGGSRGKSGAPLRAAVIHLPRISNYTDFAPLEAEPDLALDYFTDPGATPALDVVFLPGTKSTIADLAWLRQSGWESYLARHRGRGGFIVGICGGYQMLGRRLLDPLGVESDQREALGFALLDLETHFERDKITAEVAALDFQDGLAVEGYEIHAGRIAGGALGRPLLRIIKRRGMTVAEPEGAVSADGRVLGTSIHGVFDKAQFRRRFLDRLRSAKGLPASIGGGPDAAQMRQGAYDLLAETVRRHTQWERILTLATGA